MVTKSSVALTNIKIYKMIVDSHYQQYLELASKYDLLDKADIPLEEKDGKLYEIQTNMDANAAVIVVFGHMTIEAFCNIYLLQKLSKAKVDDMSFIDKVDLTVVSLLKDNGTAISETDAPNYYGTNIAALVKIRKRFVHRYPIRFELNHESEEAFEKDAACGAQMIEDGYLRRIKGEDVQNAAEAYQKLINTLETAGVDFSKIGFIYK